MALTGIDPPLLTEFDPPKKIKNALKIGQGAYHTPVCRRCSETDARHCLRAQTFPTGSVFISRGGSNFVSGEGLPEVIAWTFPGVAFFAAFPMGKAGMGIYQWLMIGGALAVGSRVLTGFPMFGLKLKGKKLTDLRALTSVTIGVAALGCCAMSQEDFGWNWKVYVGAVLLMSIISFCSIINVAEGMRKRTKR